MNSQPNSGAGHQPCMTPEQFKERWESDETGGGITMADIAACATNWGLASYPKNMPMSAVRYLVLKAAGVNDLYQYRPNSH